MRVAYLCLAVPMILACSNSSIAKPPKMNAYCTWFTSCLDAIAVDMPSITKSAETAAQLFVKSDYVIGAWGDPAFVSEFSGRAGGLMPVSSPRPAERQVAKAIILVTPRLDRLEADLKQAARMKRADNLLLLFAGPRAKKAASDIGLQFDSVVDTHSSEHGGLFENSNGKWVVPTDRVATLTALWTWTGEFVGACTRLGKMPVLWQSLSCPGSEQRAAKYRGLKFHDTKIAPIKPGELGRDYLTALTRKLQILRTEERDNIAAVARRAANARAQEKTFYVCGAGHAMKYAPDSATDPGVFTFLPEHGNALIFQPGDLLFCNGYDAHFLSVQFGPIPRECRKLEGSVAWSLTTYGGRPVSGVARGETVIDQQWDLGDAIVTVPGYDIKILPSSGVIAEAVLWMVAAATLGR